MSKLKKMMKELRISRQSARSILHAIRALEQVSKRKMREAVKKKEWEIVE